MAETAPVLEYKCPCCGAGLPFDEKSQKMICQYCDTEFELDAVKAFNEADAEEESVQWEETEHQDWSGEEAQTLRTFVCSSCAGELMTDENTVATFCPYCGNPAIVPQRVHGGLKPDGVIPFSRSKEDAKQAFLRLCKGKPLLPKDYANQQQIDKITGMYVPFWLYDCDSDFHGRYRATRVRHWSDSNYNYTKTDYFQLVRGAQAEFIHIPMDASKKMEDAMMESIEPYNYKDLMDFETAYLSGFLADKYDVEAKAGENRIRQRVGVSIEGLIQPTMTGYTSVVPTSKQLQIQHSKAKYVLLPVWMLSSSYKGKTYQFAMNGQTGKITGTLPICAARAWAWFGGICAGVTALITLIQLFAV